MTIVKTYTKIPRVDYADRLDVLLKQAGFTGYIREYRFAAIESGGPGRGLRDRLQAIGLKDWRFDFAFVDQQVAIEVDGGGRQAVINPSTGLPLAVGRHSQSADYEKLNKAQLLGWIVLRYTLDMLRGSDWIDEVRAALYLR